MDTYLVRQRRALQSAPTFCEAFFTALLTCSSNRTCSSIVMPRYFAWGTAGSGFPRHLTVMSWPGIRRTWLLLVFRIRFRSWRWLAISVVDVVRTRDTSWQSGWLNVRAISSANCTERDGLAMVGTCPV